MVLYRPASLEDDRQLLDLTSSVGMKGIIQIRTDRNPSFFKLMELRGKSHVIVGEENGKIVGSICITHEEVFIQQKVTPLFYIADFKVAPSHRNKGIGLQLTNEAVKYLESVNADFTLLHVSKGNKRPFAFFSDRKGYPDFENIGTFKIFQLTGSQKNNPKIQPVLMQPRKEIIDFLNDYYKHFELASLITESSLEKCEVYGFSKGDKLKGVVCISDTSDYKQHVPLKLPSLLKFFIKLYNFLCPITGKNKLPKIGSPIKMLNIKYLAVPDLDKTVIRALIEKARNEVYHRSHTFVSIGLHEKDPILKQIPGYYKITFYSVGMLVTMRESFKTIEAIRSGIPYKDFSTV
nr:GNAT family N-acetyltransferase [uncultured Allomuricauda sp.]